MRKTALLIAVLAALVLCHAPAARMILDSLGALERVTGEIFASPATGMKLVHTVILAGLTTLAALVVGVGFALAVTSGLVPGARLLRILGVGPLMIPPIVAAMAWSDTRDPDSVSGAARVVVQVGQFIFDGLGGLRGILGTVMILALCLYPFVSILTVRALEAVDARLLDAARLARGEWRARRLLLRLIAPDALVGGLFVFIFAASEFGVPEYLSVMGSSKRWYTYPEEVFSRWDLLGRQGQAAGADAVAASWPLILLTLVALLLLLRFRAKGTAETVRGDHESLVGRRGHLAPRRARLFGALGLLWALATVGFGLAFPVAAMLTWTEGFATFGKAWTQAGGDLLYSIWTALAAGGLVAALALPLGHLAARHRWGRWVETLMLLPLAAPAILVGIGLIRLWNGTDLPLLGGIMNAVYDADLMLILAYAGRFLPLAVLCLAAWFRRVPRNLEEAALLTGASPWKRFRQVHLPMALPAAAAAAIITFVLSMRELDLAARIPAGNGTAINRIANVVHFGGQDVGAALALLLLMCSVAPVFLHWVVTGRRPEVA